MFVVRAHHLADRFAFAQRLGHGFFARDDGLGRLQHALDFGLRDEHRRAAIRHHVVARGNRDIADVDRFAGRHFHDAPARRARRVIPREHRKIQLAAVVDIARRAVHDHARHAAHLRADRKIPAPGGRVQAGVLLDHDDVARRSRFDRGRAKMASVRAAFGAVQLDGQHAPGDAAGPTRSGECR